MLISISTSKLRIHICLEVFKKCITLDLELIIDYEVPIINDNIGKMNLLK